MLEKQSDTGKDQYKFLKDQINVNINNREDNVKIEDGDNNREDMSDKSNITKEFNEILEDIKNNGRTSQSISVKNHGSLSKLHQLITKINAEKRGIVKDYAFDEGSNIFDE